MKGYDDTELDTGRGMLPGPYDREAGLRRIAAAEKRKEQRVARAKAANRRRNKVSKKQRRMNRKASR